MATVTCVNSPMNGARRECGEFGVWGEAALPCQCPADGEWSAQLAGIHEIICENGAKITRECQVDGSWLPPNGSWLPPNGSCRDNSCPADGVFPAGREVSHVFDGLIPATSFLHDQVPHSRSGQC